jgi:hypothetical protein
MTIGAAEDLANLADDLPAALANGGSNPNGVPEL